MAELKAVTLVGSTWNRGYFWQHRRNTLDSPTWEVTRVKHTPRALCHASLSLSWSLKRRLPSRRFPESLT